MAKRTTSKKQVATKTSKAVIAGVVGTAVAVAGIGGYSIGNAVGDNNHSLRPTYVIDGSRLARAKENLTTLQSQKELPTEPYNDNKYKGWADLDGDGCDTRQEILFHDLKIRESDGTKCGLSTGTGFNYYSADKERYLNYDPTRTDKYEVQIDHIVSKKNAYDSGGYKWDNAVWKQFINYEDNLIATYAYDNASKGGKDITEWQPSNTKFHCLFAVKQVETKTKFDLTVTEAERNKLKDFLDICRVRKSSNSVEVEE